MLSQVIIHGQCHQTQARVWNPNSPLNTVSVHNRMTGSCSEPKKCKAPTRNHPMDQTMKAEGREISPDSYIPPKRPRKLIRCTRMSHHQPCMQIIGFRSLSLQHKIPPELRHSSVFITSFVSLPPSRVMWAYGEYKKDTYC